MLFTNERNLVITMLERDTLLTKNQKEEIKSLLNNMRDCRALEKLNEYSKIQTTMLYKIKFKSLL